jgi:hypothetical protein
MYGRMGKIPLVDLTKSIISAIETQPYADISNRQVNGDAISPMRHESIAGLYEALKK